MSKPEVRSVKWCDLDRRAVPLEKLMKSYLEGCPVAFRKLHAHLRPYVRRQIAARVRDATDVEDLTQTTFLRIHAGRRSYQAPETRGDRAVIAWVCAIARNTAITHLRRAQSDRLCFDGAAQRRVEGAASNYAEPHALSARDEAVEQCRDAVRRAVAGLPVGQREVVERAKLRGVPMQTIATQLGVRHVAVRVRAHRAYKNLRKALQEVRHRLGMNLNVV